MSRADFCSVGVPVVRWWITVGICRSFLEEWLVGVDSYDYD